MTFAVLPDGTVAAVNKLGAERLGYPQEALVGGPLTRVVADEDWPMVADQLRLALGGTERLVKAEFRKRRRDGSLLWVRDSLHAACDREGRPLVLISCEDITDLKRMEAALRGANSHLQELDRLKTNLVHSVSHELRTPLTSIQGYAEFLLDGIGGELSEEQQAFAGQIEQGARQLSALIDDLLDVARLEAGGLTLVRGPLDLTVLARQVLEAFGPQAQRKGIELSLADSAPSIEVLADERRVRQVLVNLVGNALRFTPEGKRIWLTIEPCEGEVCLAVHDQGIGLEARHLGHVFERFYQVDMADTRGYSGTGLGLAISKGLIEAHGGRIGASSPGLGQGSTFWFCLTRE